MEADSVVAVPGSLDRLTEVRWKENDFDVVLSHKDGSIEVSATNTKKDEKEIFPGTQRAREFLERLAPLRAARSLGKPEGDNSKTLGFDEPTGSLTLNFGGREATLEVGGTTYGTGNYYVRNSDGEIFLVPSRTFSSIRHGGGSLVDRRVLGVEEDSISRVLVHRDGQVRELVHRHPSEAEQRFFADPAEPDEKLQVASNMMNRALRLRVDERGVPAPSGPSTARLEIFGQGELLVELELWAQGEKILARSSRFDGDVLEVSKTSGAALLKEIAEAMSEGRS